MHIVGPALVGLGYPRLKTALTGSVLPGLVIIHAPLLRFICEQFGKL